jgi:Sep15/SelM redox domain/SURF1 family
MKSKVSAKANGALRRHCRVMLVPPYSHTTFYTALLQTHPRPLLSRLPELKSFLRDGEALWYRNVQINYVRGQQGVLRVRNKEGIEVGTHALTHLRRKEDMHRVLVDAGFVRKTDAERHAEEDAAQRLRQQRQRAMFHRQEYVRQMELHATWFRRDVMHHDNALYDATTWVHERDWLHENYDAIFQYEAIEKYDVWLYATRYLQNVEQRLQQQEGEP